MGSPLSPILADVALDSVIDRALQALPFVVPVIRKYVDDLFLAVPENTIPEVLDAFNKQEPRLQFTAEAEQERQLPYLDMTVIRKENQTLTTDWYSKPIASGRMLNFYSCHRMKQKINTASNFIHRVMSLSRNSSVKQQTTIIHEYLQNNNYPRTLINRLIHNQISASTEKQRTNSDPQPPPNPQPPPKTPPPPDPDPPLLPNDAYPQSIPNDAPLSLHTRPNPPSYDPIPAVNNNINSSPQPPETATADDNIESAAAQPNQRSIEVLRSGNTQQATLFRSVPYVPLLTERLTKMLKHDYPQYKIATRQHHTTNQFLSRVKDPTNKLDRKSIVYKIPCNNCNCCYIGMTNNKLNTRLVGHKSNIKRLEEVKSGTNTTTTIEDMKEKTALIRHCIESGHNFDLTNTTILDHSRFASTLSFLEMCHIYTTPHTVNKREDIAGLNTAYASLLTRLNSNSQTNTPSSSINSQYNNPQ